ncbi:MipA/OmpV family protein [uncultured Cohaesibacter sp.]|uniref:MipA/OmpV family protein n=1 Tax=uncultured Cohaesibacter sp. TaxID=1002546 RepID=UPI00292E0D28|nr:MipA/OmpV family protein [uncultured Cohaesibacter sp.]
MKCVPLGLKLLQVSLSIGVAGVICHPERLLAANLPSEGAIYSEPQSSGTENQPNNWNLVLGGGALLSPEFEGSDKFKGTPFPVVFASYKDWIFFDPSGLTASVYQTNGFSLAVRAGYDLGRKEDDSDYLKGMGDIDAGGVIGAKLGYRVGDFGVYSSVDKIVGGSDGLQAKIGAEVSHSFDRFRIGAGVSATWADDQYMEEYFGVSSAQSLRSGLPTYEAKAGFKRVDFTASATYQITDHWLVRGEAGVGQLLGDAADSPIVQDKFQPSGMLSIGYKF